MQKTFKKSHFISLVTMLASLSLSAQTPLSPSKAGVRWWWPGSAVDTANLRWSMEQFASHGIGAVEITPIYGVQHNERNNIAYLSPKWMEMLRYVEALGKKHGIEIDMATGTGWPFGGPWVPLEESASQMVIVDTIVNQKTIPTLSLNPPAKKSKHARLVGIYAFPRFKMKNYGSRMVRLTYDERKQLVPTDKKQKLGKGEWRIIALWQKLGVMMVKRAAPGSQGYVIDHFNKQCVEHYLKYISDSFEKTRTPFPHAFFNDSYEVSEGDYTTDLFPEFQKRRRYSLEENLDKLVDGDAKTVSDYRETLGDLILENFTETWTDWAHRHGALTRNQAHGSPANLIDCYSAVDIPEIEGFGLTDFGIRGLRKDSGYTRKNDSDFSMLKYAPSAAHILGKPYTSSETFTWLTEHFRTSLSQMKPDLDLMFCAGVNHVFFHGSCYSPKDDAWPGYKFYASIDMSPTNTIWRDAPYLMRYIQNCQTLLQQGKPDNDFLVLLPVRDMWTKRTKEKRLMQFAIHTMNELAPEFIKTICNVDSSGFDCDYISEKYLLTTSCKNGMLVTAAGQKYKGLIVPDDKTIMTDAVRRHITTLHSQGANIITGVDTKAMEKTARPEMLRTQLGLKMIRRTTDKGFIYFIANLTPCDIDKTTKLARDYKTARWYDPMTDKFYSTESSADGMRIRLKSGQSMFLFAYTNEGDRQQKDPALAMTEIPGTSFNLDRDWTLSFTEEAPKVDWTFHLDSLATWERLDDAKAKITMGTGIYETTFFVGEEKSMKKDCRKSKAENKEIPMPATGGLTDGTYQIDLGDVRESARVYINNQYIGCAWAVPFILTFDGSVLKLGKNIIRIEITNLPANRIADLDRKKVPWRKFDDINIVDIHYDSSLYADWLPVPSGLNSTIRIYQVK